MGIYNSPFPVHSYNHRETHEAYWWQEQNSAKEDAKDFQVGQPGQEGGIIEVTEKGNNGRGDEMSLGFSFPQFCATCEKQIFTPNNNQLFCSEGCRLYDSPTDVSVI